MIELCSVSSPPELMCCRRSTGSCVQQLLSLHERLHRVDTNVRHVPVRRSILTVLSTAVATGEDTLETLLV